MTLQESIARMEGFFAPTSNWSQINNNPGNLRASALAVGTNGGYAVFQTVEDGWKALGDLLNRYAGQGLSLRELFYKYAPPTDNNDTEGYISYVAGQLGVSPETPVATVLASGGSGSGDSSPSTDVPTTNASLGTDTTIVGIGVLILFGVFIVLRKVSS